MTTHRITDNGTYVTEVTARPSDKYSGLMYVKLTRDNREDEIRGVNEMFMTPQELENFGHFLIEQARIAK